MFLTNFKEGFELKIKYNVQDCCKKALDILIFDAPEISKRGPARGKKDRKYSIILWNNSCKK